MFGVRCVVLKYSLSRIFNTCTCKEMQLIKPALHLHYVSLQLVAAATRPDPAAQRTSGLTYVQSCARRFRRQTLPIRCDAGARARMCARSRHTPLTFAGPLGHVRDAINQPTNYWRRRHQPRARSRPRSPTLIVDAAIARWLSLPVRTTPHQRQRARSRSRTIPDISGREIAIISNIRRIVRVDNLAPMGFFFKKKDNFAFDLQSHRFA